VQQYQRYFSDADRVLILLHNDPDPDAMASGLALRNVLRRTKTTAIIAALEKVNGDLTRQSLMDAVRKIGVAAETVGEVEYSGNAEPNTLSGEFIPIDEFDWILADSANWSSDSGSESSHEIDDTIFAEAAWDEELLAN
jgi:hypothetical protein